MLLAPEDVLTVSSNALASGPSITGSIEPERRADLRAEVSAVVLAVLKENGDPVKRGDLHRAARPDLDPRQPDRRRSVGARRRPGVRTGRAPVPAHGHAAKDRRGVHAAGRRRGDPPQYRAERSRRGAHAHGHRPPAARTHRSARAVRRHRQRPQGVGGRHRCRRQGTGQGHRPDQPALRRTGVGRQHRRSEGRSARVVQDPRLLRRTNSRA